MSIILSYSGKIDKFIESTRIANDILKSEDFFTLLSSRSKPYTETVPTDLDPKLIAKFFRESNLKLKLKEYSRHRTIGGAFDPSYPNSLWVNKNTNRSGCEFAAVLVHECVHALSYHTPNYDFSHDDDDSDHNQETAPYQIQREVKKHFCGLSLTDSEDLAIVETHVSEEDIVDEE